MKTKSLLLGSAAALFAVTGARAADAVVIPEPELVEYVRICDAAGTGYFYIPGTETCLKIGGYVRYEAGVGELDGADWDGDGDNDTWNKKARFAPNIATYADTAMGPLRTEAEIEFNYATFGAPYANGTVIDLNHAWIDLAGFRVGVADSYFSSFTGYGGPGLNSSTKHGGYGQFTTNFIAYQFAAGSFSGVVSVEEGSTSSFGLANTPFGPWGIDDYVPHVVVGLGYDAGIVNLRGVVGYDTRDYTIAGVDVVGGFAGKLRADVDVTDNAALFAMLMYGENSAAHTTWQNGAVTDSTWAVIGGGSIGFTDALKFNAQVQWNELNGSTLASDVNWGVTANIQYNVTPGFYVRPEVHWNRRADGSDRTGGLLRFEASY